MNINLRIEQLILDGVFVPRSQRPRLQAAVEAELARLLAAEGLATGLRAGGALPAAPAGTIQLTSENNPADLGRQIARTVYIGIGNETTSSSANPGKE